MWIALPLLAALPACSALQNPLTDDLSHAPPPLTIGEWTGVPIDIDRLEGKVVFDLEKRTAHAVADLWFQLSEDGMPIFDLRQDIGLAQLNGEALDPELMSSHKVSARADSLRLLRRELKVGEEYHLHLEYPLAKPRSRAAIDIDWGEGAVSWDFYFSDLNPGRYMEMWFPSNLIYDHFGFEMELELRGAAEDHEIVTNAATRELAEHHWQLSFPKHYTAMSHMLVVIPTAHVERSESTVKAGGQTVTIDVVRRKDTRVSLKEVHQATAASLRRFIQDSGPWPHGDRCTVFVWAGGRSMEYDGATTTAMAALEHEIHHSWWGRGVKPRSQNDGWWDEAWTVYYGDGRRANRRVLDAEGRATVLCSADPWNRITPDASYGVGAVAFHRIADVIGEKELEAKMRALFEERALQTLSTQELEQYLHDVTGNDIVKQVFHRYVYGREGHWEDAKPVEANAAH